MPEYYLYESWTDTVTGHKAHLFTERHDRRVVLRVFTENGVTNRVVWKNRCKIGAMEWVKLQHDLMAEGV